MGDGGGVEQGKKEEVGEGKHGREVEDGTVGVSEVLQKEDIEVAVGFPQFVNS